MRLLSLSLVFVFLACGDRNQTIEVSNNDYHNAVDHVTKIMVHDIFSPPVASRVYVYPCIAAYEVFAINDTIYKTLSGQLKGLNNQNVKPAEKNIKLEVASLVAFFEVSKSLLFSENLLTSYTDSIYSKWEHINSHQFKISKEYGETVAEIIKEWLDKDNYKQTRTMPKFTVNLEDKSRWQPTPPAYMDGIEPHWNEIRTMLLDSASQFRPNPHPAFSLDEKSKFYEELREVYDIERKISVQGDDSEEIAIARFWDCNPYVSVTRGHFMFATKKISPGAHWIGICKIASKKAKQSFPMMLQSYAKTSIALFDAFISCWDEKFRSNLIRPETLINQYIDPEWKPVLQTPPFPEYTSGHSVISSAAAITLTSIFGDSFSFEDTTELPFGLPARTFDSFIEASQEAAISRLYGGIHYRAAVEEGLTQGKMIGAFVVEKLKL